MNEHELEPTAGLEGGADTESENWRSEMNVIQADIEQGNTLTPELYTRFQELGGLLADRESGDNIIEGQKARWLLAIDSAELQFKAGFVEEAIENLKETGDQAYEAGDDYTQIVEIADDRRATYEAALAKQRQP